MDQLLETLSTVEDKIYSWNDLETGGSKINFMSNQKPQPFQGNIDDLYVVFDVLEW